MNNVLKMVGAGLVLGLAMISASKAGAEVVDSNSRKMVNPVVVGTVASFEVGTRNKGAPMLVSRVKTVEGRTYFAHGTMQGLEGTQLSIETAPNGVKYLCGGVPKNCNTLAE